MRRVVQTIALLASLGVAGMTQAGVTATVTGVSDYDFRGYTQTARDPALQGSVDWSGDYGLSAGAWASSSLDFGPGTDANVELDLYAGWAGGSENGPQYSLGAVWYTYPGANDFNYPEISAGIGYKSISGKLWYSWDEASSNLSAWYIEGNYTYPLPDDFGLTVHAGYSFGDYWKSFDGEYFDWAVGVTRSFGHFDTALKFIDGSNAVYDHSSDIFSAKAKVVFSVSTTFPWKGE
jgi:uncharacterized protein (TIGR02001 family)